MRVVHAAVLVVLTVYICGPGVRTRLCRRVPDDIVLRVRRAPGREQNARHIAARIDNRDRAGRGARRRRVDIAARRDRACRVGDEAENAVRAPDICVLRVIAKCISMICDARVSLIGSGGRLLRRVPVHLALVTRRPDRDLHVADAGRRAHAGERQVEGTCISIDAADGKARRRDRRNIKRRVRDKCRCPGVEVYIVLAGRLVVRDRECDGCDSVLRRHIIPADIVLRIVCAPDRRLQGLAVDGADATVGDRHGLLIGRDSCCQCICIRKCNVCGRLRGAALNAVAVCDVDMRKIRARLIQVLRDRRLHDVVISRLDRSLPDDVVLLIHIAPDRNQDRGDA